MVILLDGKKRKINLENILPKALFLLSIIIFAYSTFSAFKISEKYNKNLNEIEEKKARLANIQKEIEDLKSTIEYQKTDEYMEYQARKAFMVKRPDEFVLAKPNLLDKKKPIQKIELGEKKEVEKPNWQKWWDKFFGK